MGIVRSADSTLPGITSLLLLVRLSTAASNFRSSLGRLGSLSAIGFFSHNGTVSGYMGNFEVSDGLAQIEGSDILTVFP